MGSGDLRAVDWPKAGPWFALAAAVFLLNDLAFLNVTGYRPWLLVDYGLRVLVLVILLVPAAPRAVARAGVGGGMRSMVIVAALGAAVLGILADGAREPVARLVPALAGVRYPAPDSALLHAFDLSLGLALVAVPEELTFRAPLLMATASGQVGRGVGLVASSLLFGLIHWSLGLDNVVAGTLAGLAFGAAALWTRSLWPAIGAHYLVDLWHFA